jgi:ParB-like chromosome segregation protein Spo0J
MSTARSVKAAFELDGVTVKLVELLPTKALRDGLKLTPTFQAILASIREVGVIEPLMVHPEKGGKYLLLDGHSRVEALKELGVDEAFCLVATDDESYTYNRQRIHVAPIQANKMVRRAIEIGVPEERIARALNLAANTIRKNQTLLQGICPEAIELLKDKHVAAKAFVELKKVKAMRQIEIAELMTAAGTYVSTYASALVGLTPEDQLAEVSKHGKKAKTRSQDLARMEHEMRSIEKDFVLMQDTHDRTVLELTLARGYLKKLLDNGKVVRYLANKHADLLPEFQHIVEAAPLEG